jgi:hypothetical protein
MMPRTKIGRSRVEVDARECADMIFGGCPKVLRADRGTAPQVGYSAAAHKAAAKSTTDVASANSTPMTTAKATAHVTATEATSDMASAETTSDMASAEATSHVAAAKSATASGVGDIDAQATTQSSDGRHNDHEFSECRFCHFDTSLDKYQLITLKSAVQPVRSVGRLAIAGCDLMLWQNCGQRSHLALMSYLDPPRCDQSIGKIKKPALRKVVLTFLSG